MVKLMRNSAGWTVSTAIFLICIATARSAPTTTQASSDSHSAASLVIDLQKPGIKVSPMLYGIFFEEINRAGDGGLYAEMVQNRSFEDAELPIGWTFDAGKNVAEMSLDKSRPLNANNPTSLKIQIDKVDAGTAVRLINRGFDGCPPEKSDNVGAYAARFTRAAAKQETAMCVRKGQTYLFSMYCRRGDQNPSEPSTFSVTLERPDGERLGSGKIDEVGDNWEQHQCAIVATDDASDARLVISTVNTGTFWIDVVSLFPQDTFKHRPNGMRRDLAEMIAAMKPAFMRFPGGCFVEGDEIANAFRWKTTIGDIAERPGHWNLWGYRSTDGLGYFEYLQFCQDIGAEPLFVVNVGMSHHAGNANAYAVPMDQMQPFVQDALDAIEYANGPADSTWGRLRAKAGHPEPFHLKYMEIGNENGGPLYDERYALFVDAIKAKYPEMHLIADVWQGIPKSRPRELMDEHYYSTPQFFMTHAGMYDHYDRAGSHVYVGEYAVTKLCGLGNLDAALGEAAYMTGLERNSDIVTMASYAPLLCDPPWKRWNPNAINFDDTRAYGTPSFYLQCLFANNRADVILPSAISDSPLPLEPLTGGVGLGTWNTKAEYKDLKITKDGATLTGDDPTAEKTGWTLDYGDWQFVDGGLRQSTDRGSFTAYFGNSRLGNSRGDQSWSDYTVSLKARKLGGSEGFMIFFAVAGVRGDPSETQGMWNVGGWSNKSHGLEVPGMDVERVPGHVEDNRWYDLRVELHGPTVTCYLDGQQVQQVTRVPHPDLFAVAGRTNDTGEVIVKVVNTADRVADTSVHLNGVSAVTGGQSTVLSSTSISDENSFDQPTRVAPRESSLAASDSVFTFPFPAHSVTVLRLQVK